MSHKFQPATEVGRVADGAGILVELISARDPDRGAALRPLAEISATASAAARAAAKDEMLSPVGKREATRRALQAARSALRPHEAEVEARRSRADVTRGLALDGWGGKPAPEAVREVRDEIRRRKIDPIQVGADLLAAVESGDATYFRAVVDAPRAFPLTTDDRIEQARDLAVTRSSLGRRYEGECADAGELATVASAVRGELGKLAAANQLALEALGE